MRRAAMDGARGTGCAPDSGGINVDTRPGRTGRRLAGMPVPSGRLAALIAPVLIGLVALWSDEPDQELPPPRLIPGAAGALTLGFALSPDGETIATTRSNDERLSLRDGRSAERILDLPGWGWL